MNILKKLKDNEVLKYGDELGFSLNNDFALYVEIERDMEGNDYYFIEYNELIDNRNYEPLENLIVMLNDEDGEEKIQSFIRKQEEKYRPKEMSEAERDYKNFIEPHLILPDNYY